VLPLCRRVISYLIQGIWSYFVPQMVEQLFEKDFLAGLRFGCPDFDIVHMPYVIKGPKPDESLLEWDLVSNHDGCQHVVKV
jgi:hypothetical protein